jgi:hypothetical protein
MGVYFAVGCMLALMGGTVAAMAYFDKKDTERREQRQAQWGAGAGSAGLGGAYGVGGFDGDGGGSGCGGGGGGGGCGGGG